MPRSRRLETRAGLRVDLDLWRFGLLVFGDGEAHGRAVGSGLGRFVGVCVVRVVSPAITAIKHYFEIQK